MRLKCFALPCRPICSALAGLPLFIIPGVKSPPILVWKVWTHNNVFITFSKSRPVLESLHLFLVAIVFMWIRISEQSIWSTLLKTFMCKLDGDKHHQRMRVRCRKNWNRTAWAPCGSPGLRLVVRSLGCSAPPLSLSPLGRNWIILKR